MCTLIALHRCVPGAPLWIAANRDELYDRPAGVPALRPVGGRLVAAPIDCREGGAWLGVNGAGLFAGVLNRPAPQRDPSRRSRGLLLLDVLGRETTAIEAAEALQALPRRAYNPFNFFVADGREAFAVVYEDVPEAIEMGSGAHVLGNADPDARSLPEEAALLDRAAEVATAPPERVGDLLAELCRSHAPAAESVRGACVHGERYGTRSSTRIRLADDPRAHRFEFADGPPCRTPYDDYTPLLGELGCTVRAARGDEAVRNAI